MAKAQQPLRLHEFIRHNAHQGGHKDRNNALDGIKPRNQISHTNSSQVVAHTGKIGAPNGELKEIHQDKAKLDILHSIRCFFYLAANSKFRIKILISAENVNFAFQYDVLVYIAMDAKEVVMISGASSGIGKALAIEMLRRGYCVSLSARRPEVITEYLAQTLPHEEIAARCLVVKTDVTVEEDCRRLVE